MVSPAPDVLQPFHLISDDPEDIEYMRRAEEDPNLVILSDWSHYTSEEYQTIMEESGVDLLYEPHRFCRLRRDTDINPSAVSTVF
jgi:hypothetical protein